MMKNVIFVMICMTIIPFFAFGRGNGKKRYDDNSTKVIIRPGDAMGDEELVSSYYYPGENGLSIQKKKRDNGTDWKQYEIRFDGCLAKGVGKLKDTNGNYHLSGIYNYSPNFSFGAGTGLYYSVGPYATHSVPIIVLADYYFQSYMGFTPYLEAYGGYLIGFQNGNLKTDAPNMGIFGMKAGISYNLYKSFHIRLAINYFNTTDNRSKTHGNTAESCIGPCGSIGYKF